MIELQEGDVGVRITFSFLRTGGTPVDLSAATDYLVRLQTPKNVSKEYPKVDLPFVTDGTDGQVLYTTKVDDIDEPGKWLGQGFVDKVAVIIHGKQITIYDVSSNIQPVVP